MMEKSVGHHLNWVSKVNSTKNGTNWHYVPPDVKQWEVYNIIHGKFLPKTFQLNCEETIRQIHIVGIL